jgi:PLP dependent protein
MRAAPHCAILRQPCQLRPEKVIGQTMSSPQPSLNSAAANLADILARIEAARKAALKPAASTTLVAVSKTFGPEAIRPVVAAGQRVFGENRVQEAKAKWPPLKVDFPEIALHLVGPLQSNKAREAVALFDAIHSLDRPKLAETLCHEFKKTERRPLLFIQVNTGEEPQKAGVFPRDASKFIDMCREELNLTVYGLMCVPPADQPPAPHFALLAKIAREHGLEGLSMGMSADFETAIRLGATHVRIGTGIFGDRMHSG